MIDSLMNMVIHSQAVKLASEAEKLVLDYQENMPQEAKLELEEAIAELKKAIEDGDSDEISAAVSKTTNAMEQLRDST